MSFIEDQATTTTKRREKRRNSNASHKSSDSDGITTDVDILKNAIEQVLHNRRVAEFTRRHAARVIQSFYIKYRKQQGAPLKSIDRIRLIFDSFMMQDNNESEEQQQQQQIENASTTTVEYKYEMNCLNRNESLRNENKTISLTDQFIQFLQLK